MPSSGVQTCALDRKSTRLNSSHTIISYAVFCLKKKIRRRRFHPRQRHTRAGVPLVRLAALGVRLVHGPPRARTILFFNDTATTEIYPLPLHDALPISARATPVPRSSRRARGCCPGPGAAAPARARSEEHTSELQSHDNLVCRLLL